MTRDIVTEAVEAYELARAAWVAADSPEALKTAGAAERSASRKLIGALLDLRHMGEGYFDRGGLRYAANPATRDLMRWPYVPRREPTARTKHLKSKHKEQRP